MRINENVVFEQRWSDTKEWKRDCLGGLIMLTGWVRDDKQKTYKADMSGTTVPYTDLIGVVLQKGQVHRTCNRRACMARCMSVEKEKEFIKIVLSSFSLVGIYRFKWKVYPLKVSQANLYKNSVAQCILFSEFRKQNANTQWTVFSSEFTQNWL